MPRGNPENKNAKGRTSNPDSKPVLYSGESLTDTRARLIGASPQKAKNWIPVACTPARGNERVEV